MKTLATPQDICQCGHKKTFHAWLRTEEMSSGEPLVRFASCDFQGCTCAAYEEAASGSLSGKQR